jgi:hypothetical protein
MREHVTIEDLGGELERSPAQIEALVVQMGETLHHSDFALQGFEPGPDRNLLAIDLGPPQVDRIHARFDSFH